MTNTHCPYCSLQCGMTLVGQRTLEVRPWAEFPVNEGALCRKGWTATGLRGHRERLTTPLVRDRATGELRAAEATLSSMRHEIHQRLDEATAQLIARYRQEPALALTALPDIGLG